MQENTPKPSITHMPQPIIGSIQLQSFTRLYIYTNSETQSVMKPHL